MGEILFVLALVFGMLGAGALVGWKTKKWQFFFTFLIFFICFGGCEWWSIAQHGESISQTIGHLGVNNPGIFWIVIAGNIIAWAALMWHFIAMRKD